MFIIALLIGLELLIFATNFVPGTYLIGWDNVMPEFNLLLNFKRAIFSVWQDYRGLGLLDGMAHGANLMHTIYIFLLSLVLPQNLLRYTFILLTHLAGGIGMYFLIIKLLGNWKFSAMAGALFYMFNIGVIQMFYAPLEVFVVHFAALPFLTLSLIKTFDKPRAANLIILFVLALLFSPQGFVPTVFGAFLILFLAFAVIDFIAKRDIKKIVLIGFIILSANAFWLLPYSYSSIKTSRTIQSTRINQFSSEEVYLRNRARGDIESVFGLRGFMLDSIEYDKNQDNNIFLMQTWRDHYNLPLTRILSFLFVLIALFGFIAGIIKREKKVYPFAISGAISFFFLANNTLILAQLNELLRTLVPTLAEALRFPFTKFIILFSFCFSIFFTIGVSALFELIRKPKLLFVICQLLTVAAILWIAAPAFRGNFFSPLLKVSLPKSYQETFLYFSHIDKNARIAVLPATTFWNWQYTNWGQIGSGFLWYGIEQPLMLRSFDPWSLYNEQFYNELSYAINKGDANLLAQVFKKYDVSYLLLDKSIVNSVTRGSINYLSLENLLESVPSVNKVKQTGNIVIYAVGKDKSALSILDVNTIPKVFPSFHFGNKDTVFEKVGNYVNDNSKPDIINILPSLYTGKLQDNVLFEFENTKDAIVLKPKIDLSNFENSDNLNLELPSLYANEFLIPVKAQVQGNSIIFTPLYPTVFINRRAYHAEEEKIIINTRVTNPTAIEFVDTNNRIDFVKQTKAYLLNNYINSIKITGHESEEILTINTQGRTLSSFLIPLPHEKIRELKIVVDKFDSSLNIGNVVKDRMFKVTQNADPFKIYASNILTTSKYTQDGVILAASGNSSVDLSFYRDNLPHMASYIVFVESAYKSGLPVNFYVENTFENRAEIETKLSKKQKNNVIIIPQTENVFKGYGFHFTAKSVGAERAEILLSDVELVPFPQETIERININYGQAFVPHETAPVMTLKINPSLYLATVQKPAGQQYITLSQAYDAGWHAYRIQNSESRIMNYASIALPFIFGSELKEHVEVNSWANAWVIEPSTINNRQSTIIIAYLPQYLEYAGLLILASLFGLLGGIIGIKRIRSIRGNS